ncbi:hypothetical protein KEM48_006123 [Puccinia striiformis f. sp. tritici PST-130]|nr:hypothetical protein KEM48_006123 [Puccinia striiformis f. sp. tritici PST-130]
MNNPCPTIQLRISYYKTQSPRPRLLFSFLVDTNYKREKKTLSNLSHCHRVVASTNTCLSNNRFLAKIFNYYNKKKDKYLLTPYQNQNKENFVLFGLCDKIEIDHITITNFEFFSSMFKLIKLTVSSSSAEPGVEVGYLKTHDTRGFQAGQKEVHGEEELGGHQKEEEEEKVSDELDMDLVTPLTKKEETINKQESVVVGGEHEDPTLIHEPNETLAHSLSDSDQDLEDITTTTTSSNPP